MTLVIVFYPERHLKIETTDLELDKVACQIAAQFSLAPATND